MSKRFIFVPRTQNRSKSTQNPASQSSSTEAQQPDQPHLNTTPAPLHFDTSNPQLNDDCEGLPDLPKPTVLPNSNSASTILSQRKPTRFLVGHKKPSQTTSAFQKPTPQLQPSNSSIQIEETNDAPSNQQFKLLTKDDPTFMDSDLHLFAQDIANDFDFDLSPQLSTQQQHRLQQPQPTPSFHPNVLTYSKPSTTSTTTPLAQSQGNNWSSSINTQLDHLYTPVLDPQRAHPTTPQRSTPQHRRSASTSTNPHLISTNFDTPHQDSIAQHKAIQNSDKTFQFDTASQQSQFNTEDQAAGWMGGLMSSVNSVFQWATGTPKAKPKQGLPLQDQNDNKTSTQSENTRNYPTGDTLSQMSKQSQPITIQPGGSTPRSMAFNQHGKPRGIPELSNKDTISDSLSINTTSNSTFATPNRPRRNSAVDLLVDAVTPSFTNIGNNYTSNHYHSTSSIQASNKRHHTPQSLFASTPTNTNILLLTPQNKPMRQNTSTSNRSATPLTTSTNPPQSHSTSFSQSNYNMNEMDSRIALNITPNFQVNQSYSSVTRSGQNTPTMSVNKNNTDEMDTISQFSFNFSLTQSQLQQHRQFQRAGIPSLSQLQPNQQIPGIALSIHSQRSTASQNGQTDLYSTPSLHGNAQQQRRFGNNGVLPLFSMKPNVANLPHQTPILPSATSILSPGLGKKPTTQLLRQNSVICSDTGRSTGSFLSHLSHTPSAQISSQQHQNQLLFGQVKQYQSLIAPNVVTESNTTGKKLTTQIDQTSNKKYQEFFTPTVNRYGGNRLSTSETSSIPDVYKSQNSRQSGLTIGGNSNNGLSITIGTPSSPRQLSPSLRDAFVNEKHPDGGLVSTLNSKKSLVNVCIKQQQAEDYFRSQHEQIQLQIQQTGQLDGLSVEDQEHLLMMMGSGMLFGNKDNDATDNAESGIIGGSSTLKDPVILDLYPNTELPMDQLILWQCFSFTSRQPQQQIEDILSGMNSIQSTRTPFQNQQRKMNISFISQLQQLQHTLRHPIENKLSNVFDIIAADWNYAWNLYTGQFSSVQNVYNTIHQRFSQRLVHLRYLLTDVQNSQLRHKDVAAVAPSSTRKPNISSGTENPHGIITENIPQHHEYYALLLSDQIKAVQNILERLEADYKLWENKAIEFKQQRDCDVGVVLPGLCQNALKMIISAFIIKSIQYLYLYFQNHTRNKNKQSKAFINGNEIQSKLSDSLKELEHLDTTINRTMYTRYLLAIPGLTQPSQTVTGGFLTPKVGEAPNTLNRTPGKDPNHLDIFETISNISPHMLGLFSQDNKMDEKQQPPMSTHSLDTILSELDKQSPNSHEAQWHQNIYKALKLFITDTLPDLILAWTESVDAWNQLCSLEVQNLFISHHKGFSVTETTLEKQLKQLQKLYYEKYRLSTGADTSAPVKSLTPSKTASTIPQSHVYISVEEIDQEIQLLNRAINPSYSSGKDSHMTPGIRSRRRQSFSEQEHRARSSSRTSRSPSLRPRSNSRESGDSNHLDKSEMKKRSIATLDDLALFFTTMSSTTTGGELGTPLVPGTPTPSELLVFVENGSPSLLAGAELLLMQFTNESYARSLSGMINKKKTRDVVPNHLWFRKAPKQSLSTHQVIIDLLNQPNAPTGLPDGTLVEHRNSLNPFPQPLFKHGVDVESDYHTAMQYKKSLLKRSTSFPHNRRVWSIGLVLGCFLTMYSSSAQDQFFSVLQQSLLPRSNYYQLSTSQNNNQHLPYGSSLILVSDLQPHSSAISSALSTTSSINSNHSFSPSAHSFTNQSTLSSNNSTSTHFTSVSRTKQTPAQFSHHQQITQFFQRFSPVQIDDFIFTADFPHLVTTIIQSFIDYQQHQAQQIQIQLASKAELTHNVSHTSQTSQNTLSSFNTKPQSKYPIPTTPVLSSHNSLKASSRATTISSGTGFLSRDLEDALAMVPREVDNPHFFSYLSSYTNPLHALYNPYLQFLYNTDCYDYILSQLPFEVLDWVLLTNPTIIWDISRQFNNISHDYLSTTLSKELMSYEPYFQQYTTLQTQLQSPTMTQRKPEKPATISLTTPYKPSLPTIAPSPALSNLLSPSLSTSSTLISPQILINNMRNHHATPQLVASVFQSNTPPFSIHMNTITNTGLTKEEKFLLEQMNKYHTLSKCFVVLQHNYINSLEFLQNFTEHSATIQSINGALAEMYSDPQISSTIRSHPFSTHFSTYLATQPESQSKILNSDTFDFDFTIEMVQTDPFINVPLHEALRREGLCKPKFRLTSSKVIRLEDCVASCDDPKSAHNHLKHEFGVNFTNQNSHQSAPTESQLLLSSKTNQVFKSLHRLDHFLFHTSLNQFEQISTLVKTVEQTRQQIRSYSHSTFPSRSLPAFPTRFDDIVDESVHASIITTPSLALVRTLNTTSQLQTLSRLQHSQNRAIHFSQSISAHSNISSNTFSASSGEPPSIEKTIQILPLPPLSYSIPELYAHDQAGTIKNVDNELWHAAHPTAAYISAAYSNAVNSIRKDYATSISHHEQPTISPSPNPLLELQKQTFIQSLSQITNIAQLDSLYNIYFVKTHSDITISLIHTLYNCLSTTIPNIQHLPLTQLFYLLRNHDMSQQSTRFVSELKKFFTFRQEWLKEWLYARFDQGLFELPILEPLYVDGYNDKNRDFHTVPESSLPLHKLKRSRLDELHYYCSEPGLYLHEHTMSLLSTQYPQDAYPNPSDVAHSMKLSTDSQLSGRETTRARYDFTWGSSFKFNANMYRFGLHSHLCHRQGGYYSAEIQEKLKKYLFPTHFNVNLTSESKTAVNNYIQAVLYRWNNYDQQIILLTESAFNTALKMNANYSTIYQPNTKQSSAISVAGGISNDNHAANEAEPVITYSVNQYITDLLSNPLPHLLHGQNDVLQHDSIPISNPLTTDTQSLYHNFRPYHYDLLKFIYNRYSNQQAKTTKCQDETNAQLRLSLNPTEPFYVYVSDIFDAITRVALDQHPSYLSRIIPTYQITEFERKWDPVTCKIILNKVTKYINELNSQSYHKCTRVTTSHPLYHQLTSAYKISQEHANKFRTACASSLTDAVTRGSCMIAKPIGQLLPSATNERYLVQATAPRYSIHDHENDPKSWLRSQHANSASNPATLDSLTAQNGGDSSKNGQTELQKRREAYRNFADSYPHNNKQIDVSNSLTAALRVVTNTNLISGFPNGVNMAIIEADIDLGLQNLYESSQSGSKSQPHFLNTGTKFKNVFNNSVPINPHYVMAINTLYDVTKFKEQCSQTSSNYFGAETTILINAVNGLQARPIISNKIPNPIQHLLQPQQQDETTPTSS